MEPFAFQSNVTVGLGSDYIAALQLNRLTSKRFETYTVKSALSPIIYLPSNFRAGIFPDSQLSPRKGTVISGRRTFLKLFQVFAATYFCFLSWTSRLIPFCFVSFRSDNQKVSVNVIVHLEILREWFNRICKKLKYDVATSEKSDRQSVKYRTH